MYNLEYDRYEEYHEDKRLRFLYNTVFGRIILKIAISKFVSNIYAKYMNSRLSRNKIKKFIKKNNIDMSIYENKKYSSFNDFFKRKIKNNARPIAKGLIAVADSKLTVYKITKDASFSIKNSIYTVNELIGEDIDEYNGGYALVFRLCVDDYHHYIFPDDGQIISNKKINGVLHTVQPIALKKYKVFSENSREVTKILCNNYGLVSYVEVGALMVGKIVNKKISKFKKGQEKGHFEFGGSTIILLFKNCININNKILENSKNGIETIVKMGQSLE